MTTPPPPRSATSALAIEAMLLQVTAGRDALPPGSVVANHVVDSVVGRDNTGFMYEVHNAGEQRLILEEYLPPAIAMRVDGDVVKPRSKTEAVAFALGLRAFIAEAEHLAPFDHPALVRYLRSWQQQGTAYRLRAGSGQVTLREARSRLLEPPDERWLRDVFTPVLGALRALHDTALVHSDVRPERVVLGNDGLHPMLLGFDAARRAIMSQAPALMPWPEPEFVPIELIEPSRYGPRGAWTDLYGLAAVMRFAITGEAPPMARIRADGHDASTMAAVVAKLRRQYYHCSYSPGLVEAIDAAMSIEPSKRPRSVIEFVERMNHGNEDAQWQPVPPPTLTAVVPEPEVNATPASNPSDAVDMLAPFFTAPAVQAVVEVPGPELHAPRRAVPESALAHAVTLDDVLAEAGPEPVTHAGPAGEPARARAHATITKSLTKPTVRAAPTAAVAASITVDAPLRAEPEIRARAADAATTVVPPATGVHKAPAAPHASSTTAAAPGNGTRAARAPMHADRESEQHRGEPVINDSASPWRASTAPGELVAQPPRRDLRRYLALAVVAMVGLLAVAGWQWRQMTAQAETDALLAKVAVAEPSPARPPAEVPTATPTVTAGAAASLLAACDKYADFERFYRCLVAECRKPQLAKSAQCVSLNKRDEVKRE